MKSRKVWAIAALVLSTSFALTGCGAESFEPAETEGEAAVELAVPDQEVTPQGSEEQGEGAEDTTEPVGTGDGEGEPAGDAGEDVDGESEGGESEEGGSDASSPEEDTSLPGDITSVPVRDCLWSVAVQLPPGTQNATVPNELTGWDTAAWPLADEDGDGLWTGTFDVSDLNAGPFGYKVLLNGSDWIVDPSNPERIYVDGVENSRGRIPNCAVPELQLIDLSLIHI